MNDSRANNSSVRQLSETEALRRALMNLNHGDYAEVGPGDDAAVVLAADGRFVVTTDTMVEGHDFLTRWSSGFDLGWKAAASNLADIAAMGAKPTALVAAVVVGPDTAQSWLEAFAQGLSAALGQLAPGAGVVGGDLASGPQIVIAITAHGNLDGRAPVLRSGAKPGDVVALAGTLGRAACGLALLSHPNPDLASAFDDWVNIQLRPVPPIALGVEAAIAGATAMLDVSDGLAKDAGRIARASGVSIRLNPNLLSGYEAVLELAAQSVASRADQASDSNTGSAEIGHVGLERDWVLFGGEDHGLLACFPATAKLPRGFKVIGEVTEQGAHPLYLADEILEERGWDSVAGSGVESAV